MIKANNGLVQVGDYACVQIRWITKRIFGFNVKLPNVIGYLIRLCTWSKYDHAFIYMGSGMIVEARPRGAETGLLSEYKDCKMIWSTTPLTTNERNTICKYASKLVGTPYGFLDILYLGLATAGIKIGWLLGQVEREDRMICSQLVATCGIEADVEAWLCGRPAAQMVTPADLAKLAEKGNHDSTTAS